MLIMSLVPGLGLKRDVGNVWKSVTILWNYSTHMRASSSFIIHHVIQFHFVV